MSRQAQGMDSEGGSRDPPITSAGKKSVLRKSSEKQVTPNPKNALTMMAT